MTAGRIDQIHPLLFFCCTTVTTKKNNNQDLRGFSSRQTEIRGGHKLLKRRETREFLPKKQPTFPFFFLSFEPFLRLLPVFEPFFHKTKRHSQLLLVVFFPPQQEKTAHHLRNPQLLFVVVCFFCGFLSLFAFFCFFCFCKHFFLLFFCFEFAEHNLSFCRLWRERIFFLLFVVVLCPIEANNNTQICCCFTLLAYFSTYIFWCEISFSPLHPAPHDSQTALEFKASVQKRESSQATNKTTNAFFLFWIVVSQFESVSKKAPRWVVNHISFFVRFFPRMLTVVLFFSFFDRTERYNRKQKNGFFVNIFFFFLFASGFCQKASCGLGLPI